jgi:hypothetical protein
MKDFHNIFLSPAVLLQIRSWQQEREKPREKLEPSQYVLFTNAVRAIKLGKMDVGDM